MSFVRVLLRDVVVSVSQNIQRSVGCGAKSGLLQPGFTALTGFPRDEAAMLEVLTFLAAVSAWPVCAWRRVCSWVLDRILVCPEHGGNQSLP